MDCPTLTGTMARFGVVHRIRRGRRCRGLRRGAQGAAPRQFGARYAQAGHGVYISVFEYEAGGNVWSLAFSRLWSVFCFPSK